MADKGARSAWISSRNLFIPRKLFEELRILIEEDGEKVSEERLLLVVVERERQTLVLWWFPMIQSRKWLAIAMQPCRRVKLAQDAVPCSGTRTRQARAPKANSPGGSAHCLEQTSTG